MLTFWQVRINKPSDDNLWTQFVHFLCCGSRINKEISPYRFHYLCVNCRYGKSFRIPAFVVMQVLTVNVAAVGTWTWCNKLQISTSALKKANPWVSVEVCFRILFEFLRMFRFLLPCSCRPVFAYPTFVYSISLTSTSTYPFERKQAMLILFYSVLG